MLTAKDEWLDCADDIHDLVNFYKTQITAWRKLLDGLNGFESNREALTKVPQAAAALDDLARIRDNPKPYGQVNRIVPLLAAVAAINEQLAQEKRERALASIEAKLAEVQAKLGSAATTTADLSNKTLHPLQDLKARIATQTSIAQIMLLQAAGGSAMDDAIDLIEAAATKLPNQIAEPGNTSEPLKSGQPNVPARVAHRALEFGIEAGVEVAPVGQAREPVGQRQQLQRGVVRLERGLGLAQFLLQPAGVDHLADHAQTEPHQGGEQEQGAGAADDGAGAPARQYFLF